ncbi:MAG: hypothetical protein KDJ65_28445, partial [Anaerolineae bacterium]|nr:hypothetical protein [Anaerolineae bacterium]
FLKTILLFCRPLYIDPNMLDSNGVIPEAAFYQNKLFVFPMATAFFSACGLFDPLSLLRASKLVICIFRKGFAVIHC